MNNFLIILILTFFNPSFSYGIVCTAILTNGDLLRVIEIDKNLTNTHEAVNLQNDLNSLSAEDRQTLRSYMKSKQLSGVKIGIYYEARIDALELSASKTSIAPLRLPRESHIIRDGRLLNAIKLETALNEIIDARVSINPTEIQTRLDTDAVLDFFTLHAAGINKKLKIHGVTSLSLGLEVEIRRPVSLTNFANSNTGFSLRVEMRNKPWSFINPNYKGLTLPLDTDTLSEQLLNFNRRAGEPIPTTIYNY